MSFADELLTDDMQPIRQKLLYHPLWQAIEDGTLPRERLRLFALQDWWLVREAYRLDALAIAAMPDLELQEMLIRKLTPKIGGYKLLLDFGAALGLSQTDFDNVEPVAGCMALTNFFYWMLAYGAPVEKIGAVSASEDIFVQICARVAPALQKHYGLSSAEIEFFSAHEAIGEALNPLDEQILARFDNPLDRQRLTRAVRLSHDYELMFYDTVLDHNP